MDHKNSSGHIKAESLEREIVNSNPELFKGLDANKKRALVQTIQTITAKWHSGPLPSPDTLAEYNQVLPSAAERIFTEFEAQGKHRRALEQKVIGGQTTQSYIGQVLAFIIAISFLAAAVWCISKGYEIGGGILGVADLTSLVAIFIKGKHYQRQNLISKSPKK